MGRGEAFTLLFLIAFSGFSFLPVWRQVEIAGMAMFGWLMAALMVLSPALALLALMVGRDRS
jgi:membrane protein YqaA with SNARE-associated domain